MTVPTDRYDPSWGREGRRLAVEHGARAVADRDDQGIPVAEEVDIRAVDDDRALRLSGWVTGAAPSRSTVVTVAWKALGRSELAGDLLLEGDPEVVQGQLEGQGIASVSTSGPAMIVS